MIRDQGRFKSFPVQDDDHFYTVCCYVQRNALDATLASVRRIGGGAACIGGRTGTRRRSRCEPPGRCRVVRLGGARERTAHGGGTVGPASLRPTRLSVRRVLRGRPDGASVGPAKHVAPAAGRRDTKTVPDTVSTTCPIGGSDARGGWKPLNGGFVERKQICLLAPPIWWSRPSNRRCTLRLSFTSRFIDLLREIQP